MKKQRKPKDTLTMQCDRLGISYYELNLVYDGKPELALLNYFKAQGFIGSTSEGGTILNFLKACFLDKLHEFNTFSSRSDACSRYLEAQFHILKNNIDDVINSVNDLTHSKFLSNAREILSHPFILSIYPDLNIDILSALYNSMDKITIKKIAYKFSENPYGYRSGWPDLVISKGNLIQFIEVKTTDKLHDSQLYTIPAMKEIITHEFLVYRLKKASKLFGEIS